MMIVTTVLTLTMVFADPAELVQVFAPTQGVTITIAQRDGCNQVDAWWVQCWAASADHLPVMLNYNCPTRNAIVVIKKEQDAYLLELACRWRSYLPFAAAGVETRYKPENQ